MTEPQSIAAFEGRWRIARRIEDLATRSTFLVPSHDPAAPEFDSLRYWRHSRQRLRKLAALALVMIRSSWRPFSPLPGYQIHNLRRNCRRS